MSFVTATPDMVGAASESAGIRSMIAAANVAAAAPYHRGNGGGRR